MIVLRGDARRRSKPGFGTRRRQNGQVGWLLESESSRAFSLFSVSSFFHRVFLKTSPPGCTCAWVQPGGRGACDAVVSEKALLFTAEGALVALAPREFLDP